MEAHAIMQCSEVRTVALPYSDTGIRNSLGVFFFNLGCTELQVKQKRILTSNICIVFLKK